MHPHPLRLLLITAALSGCVESPFEGSPFGEDAGADAAKEPNKAPDMKPPQDAPGTGANGGSVQDDSNDDDDGDKPSGGAAADYDGPVLAQPSRGAAVALSQDEKIAVVVNRDSGSVSVLENSYDADGKTPKAPKLVRELDLGKGSEPWQVALGPDDDTAYVVLRRDQKLVKIVKLKSYPEIDKKVSVGSEPTSVALSPTGRTAYVANWNDGTLSVIDTESLSAREPIDLNAPLVATGYLGEVKSRPALAHPRSVTVTNDGDKDDSDESVLVTEYFAQQFEELRADGTNADVNKTGLVYRVQLSDASVRSIGLGPLQDIGFKDTTGAAAGCYPNQLQSITLLESYAYVVSVCAAPEGPEGIKITTNACETVANCQGLGLVDPVCDVIAQGAAPVCQDVANFKTATSPVVSVIDLANNKEVPGAAHNLNASFDAFFKDNGVAAKKFPLFATDLAFVPGTGVGYVVGNAIDAVFRVVYDAKSGKLSSVGSTTSPFINLFPSGKGPVGIAIGQADRKFALVANNITRNLIAVDFNTQAIAAGTAVATAALPPKGSDEDQILVGKDLFNTGRARWSLAGEGWGSCQSCHSDGLTDNVTWFFGRGPRQSTSLDGSFASRNSLDQRIFNHTANRDEAADFSLNTRDTSGGVGAIVLASSTPPQNTDRIDVKKLKLNDLDGSMLQASDPANPLGLGFDANGEVKVGELERNPSAKPAGSVLPDWIEITRYIQTIRTPRAPSNLDPEKVKAGEALFAHSGSCQGCHGGDKWTVSKLFYQPSVETMAALKTTNFAVPAGFPRALLPAQDELDFQLVLNAGGDSVQCVLRNVKTFNNAEPGVGISELRNDMKTPAQGGGNVARPNADGDDNAANDPKANIGYNVPSLLGMAANAPYMHAGNARTLEAMLDPQFAPHHQALAPNFLLESNADKVAEQVEALVHYMLSIDEDQTVQDLPEPGAQGGALCPDYF
jgi:YVTN family beta-propeller protein